MVLTSVAPLLAVIVLAATTCTTAKPIVHASVPKKLKAQGSVNLILTMKTGVNGPVAAVASTRFANRGEKREALVTQLESHVKGSRKSVDELLAKKDAKNKVHNAFWITNQLLIRGASASVVEQLSSSQDVQEIREELVIPSPHAQVSGTNVTASAATPTATNEWGVNLIGAPSVWALGFRGQDVVVGSIDTGVLASHSALQPNWRATYGWYDPTAKRSKPYDDLGHGTHTVGTIIGLKGIGVAPGAKFIACKACTKDGCTESDLLACAQFMTCPTNPSGGKRDCTKAPDLVSNSWAGGQGGTFFSAAISTWQAAGIIPIFANGNSGSACTTANSPGDNANVIAVGATNINDGIADFSSRGPSVGGLLKPEISAPGVDVRSSWNAGSKSYVLLSGTSMATPHIAGVVALLLSKKPTLTYAEVKTALTSTTETAKLLSTSGLACGGVADKTYPNNYYGHGRVNALAAIGNVL